MKLIAEIQIFEKQSLFETKIPSCKMPERTSSTKHKKLNLKEIAIILSAIVHLLTDLNNKGLTVSKK